MSLERAFDVIGHFARVRVQRQLFQSSITSVETRGTFGDVGDKAKVGCYGGTMCEYTVIHIWFSEASILR